MSDSCTIEPIYLKFRNRVFARVDVMEINEHYEAVLLFPNGSRKTLLPDNYSIEVIEQKGRPDRARIVTKSADYYPDKFNTH